MLKLIANAVSDSVRKKVEVRKQLSNHLEEDLQLLIELEIQELEDRMG